MAGNLAAVGEWGEDESGKGRVIFVEKAVATFGKGGWDGETVHKVNVESLRDEFAEVMSTKEAVGSMSASAQE